MSKVSLPRSILGLRFGIDRESLNRVIQQPVPRIVVRYTAVAVLVVLSESYMLVGNLTEWYLL